MLNPIRGLKRRFLPAAVEPLQKAKQLCAGIVNELICVDVGASYYAHPSWSLLLTSDSVVWIAVDPNAENLDYLNTWEHAAKLRAVGQGLSRNGGRTRLHLTNVDSGSSILQPTVSEDNAYRTDSAYFFPSRQLDIETLTLGQVLEQESSEAALAVKLDTQGSEYDILEGMSPEQWGQTICVEMEASLMREPYYSEARKFHEIQAAMEEKGFELMCLRPIPATLPHVNAEFPSKGFLVECDAVFFRPQADLRERSLEAQFASIAMYACYDLWGEVAALAEHLHKKVQDDRADRLASLKNLLKP